MTPEEVFVLIPLVLMLLYGISQLWTWQRQGGPARLLALFPAPQRWESSWTPARSPQRVYPPAVRSRTQTRAERQIIRAALASGVDANAVAAALRGSPAYNRRRVREMASRIGQTV